eukprot:COSAG06_NODE_3699_length_4996_cov_4.274658_1_plen_100_part_10
MNFQAKRAQHGVLLRVSPSTTRVPGVWTTGSNVIGVESRKKAIGGKRKAKRRAEPRCVRPDRSMGTLVRLHHKVGGHAHGNSNEQSAPQVETGAPAETGE